MKTTRIAGIAAAFLALAACEPSSDSSSSPSSAPTPAAASGDYCDLALQGAQLQGQVADNVQDLQDSLSDPDILSDPSKYDVVRQWGQTLVDNSAQQSALYQGMRDQVTDPDVVAAFDAIIAFNDQFAAPLGQAAADATNFLEYATALTGIMSDADIQGIVQEAGAAAETIATYTVDQCGMFSPSPAA